MYGYGFAAPIVEQDEGPPPSSYQNPFQYGSSFSDPPIEPLSAPMGGSRESDVFVRPKPRQPQTDVMSTSGAPKKRNAVGVIPESSSSSGGGTIPYELQQAARTIVDAFKAGTLRHLSTEVAKVFEQIAARPNQYFGIDPLVFISYTLWTGSCNIFLKESIPLSKLLFLIHFDAEFSVEILPDGETVSRPKKFTDVSVTPFDGSSTSHAQNFKWKQIMGQVFVSRGINEMEQRDMLDNLNYFMETLGELDSANVADMLFIQEQAKLLGPALNDERAAVSDTQLGFKGDNREDATTMGGGSSKRNKQY